jgi:hypothetical protein
MSRRLEPRVLTLVADPSEPVQSVVPPMDASDQVALDRLASWLAEVSAENAGRRLARETEPPFTEPMH